MWATSVNPTTANNKVQIGGGTGVFSDTVTGLPTGSMLHVRAYATNSVGTTYGLSLSFTPPVPNEVPTELTLSNNTVLQSEGAGAAIGSLTVVDADIGDTHTFSFVVGLGDTHNEAFRLEMGALKVGKNPLSPGSYSVRIQTTDAAGATLVRSFLLTVLDDIAPAAPVVVSPANATETNDNTPTFSGAAEASATVTITVDGNAIGTATANGFGVWSFASAVPLSLGSHTVSATATDATGNVSSPSAANSFTVTPAVVPTVASPTKIVLAPTIAALGGDVTSDGGSEISAVGVVVSETAVNPNPQLGGAGVINVATSVGMGVFEIDVGILSPNTGYSFKAYATNAVGTGYTNVSTFTTSTPQPGNALAFDGTDHVLFSTPPAYNHNALTLEAWVRNTNPANSGGQLIQWGQSVGIDLAAFGLSDGRIVFGIRKDASWESVTGTRTVNDGRWHHVAVVKAGNANGNITLYVDGQPDAVSQHWLNAPHGDDATVTTTPGAFDRLCIGALYQNGDLDFGTYCGYKGAIDEVRIWSVARTADEILANMGTTLAGFEAGLAAYYRFDHGSAGGTNAGVITAEDVKIGGTACSGTLTGFALTDGNTTSNWVESYALIAPVANAASSINSRSFTANWSAPIGGLPPETYFLDVATDPAFTTLVPGYSDQDLGNVLTFTVTGLNRATPYWYRVRAGRTMAGSSANSESVAVTTADAPGIESVSVPAAGTYGTGANLEFTVTFSSVVTATGSPRLPLTIGSADRHAVYVSGGGTTTLVFRYVVQSGDADSDGPELSAAIDLNGGGLNASVSGVPAERTLNNVASMAAVVIDTTPPATPSVPATSANPTTNQRPAITGTAIAGGTVKLYDGLTLIGTAAAAGDGAWSITPTSNLSAGAHSLTATVTNALGNTSAASPALALTIESVAPPSKADQTITFGELGSRMTTDGPFSVGATASSGLSVRFAVVSGPATISGSTITLTGLPGVVTVRASQAGNSSFKPAPDVERSFSVNIATPVVSTPTQSPVPAPGGSATLSAGTSSSNLNYQWQRNGSDLAGATNPTLTLSDVRPPTAGLYTYTATSSAGASGTSEPVIIGLATTEKVTGQGEVVGADIHHPNGNTYDQLLLEGVGATLTADPGQVTRMSFNDLSDDIVQVEFSGAGSLSLVMDDASAPAPAINYNQPGVNYVRGNVGIVITGANETTNVSVISVGRMTAVNQSLFRNGVAYDGVANIAFIAIQSANGKFGGVRTGNVEYFSARGYTGIYAPGVRFTGPVYVGDIQAYDNATPALIVGSASDVRITGGSLEQPNMRPVRVDGLSQLQFTEGRTSHAGVLPAQENRAVLEQSGVDVTDLIVPGL